MRLDIRLVSTLVSTLISPLVSPRTDPSKSCSKSCHIVNTCITRIDDLREDMEMKHSGLLCELQQLKEELLELPIGNVVKEGGKRISSLKEGSVMVVDGNEGKSYRRKEWERTKWRLGSLVRRH